MYWHGQHGRTVARSHYLIYANTAGPGGAAAAEGLRLAGVKPFPTLETEIDFDLISLVGPSVYITIFQLAFPLALGGLVHEKEHKLREIKKMMGPSPSPGGHTETLGQNMVFLCQIETPV